MLRTSTLAYISVGVSTFLLLLSITSILFAANDIRKFHDDTLEDLKEWKDYSDLAWAEMTIMTRRTERSAYAKRFGQDRYAQPTQNDVPYNPTENVGAVADSCNCGVRATGCPPGPPGPPGLSGEDGYPGPPGDRGNPGASGITLGSYEQEKPGCIECPMGPPGQPGTPGFQGETGEPGLPGRPGGSAYRGPPGPMGQPGDRGESGKPGYPGHAGEPGRPSVVEVCVPGRKGPPGNEGPMGPLGQPGFSPPPGNRGLVGPMGPPGKPGLPGQPGSQGYPGRLGLPGVDAQYCPCPPQTKPVGGGGGGYQPKEQPYDITKPSFAVQAQPIGEISLDRDGYRKRIIARLLKKRRLALQAKQLAKH